VFGGGPPAIYAGVLAAPNLAGADLSALRVCPAGGAPMPVELHERWRRATGRDVHEGYGMTEMAPISGTTDSPASARLRRQGRSLQRGAGRGPGDRHPRPAAGEKGEVRVRGPHMMQGYRDRPEETAQVHPRRLHPHRRHRPPGRRRLPVHHRPQEGRGAGEGLQRLPARGRGGALRASRGGRGRGGGRARSAQRRRAAGGLRGPAPGGEALSEAEVATHCAERLVGYQCPDDIRIVEALPMTGAQKLDRIALRRMVRDAAPND
jgi:long-chain acyl-CoA synthetase